MKKLTIILILFSIFFACSSSDSDNEDEICLTCTGANFVNSLPWGDFNCDYDLEEVCVGATMSSGCFPITVGAQASLLTIDDINAIKTLWEENGANCTLN
tara:strand:- start:215 stop:514 length:300 start_codon:yes stop_codon:yes gene_type:complete